MVVMNLGFKMPGDRHCPRIDTIELKHHIVRRLGHQKTEKYFHLLSRYLSLQISKSVFNKLCIGLFGKNNISLHNGLLRAVIRNGCVSKSPPPRMSRPQSYQSSLQLLRDVCPPSPRKVRTPIIRDRRVKDRPSPLGPHEKPNLITKVQEQQSAPEILSLGSRPTSVEEGEEVEQFVGVPLRAPFGICLPAKGKKKVLSNTDTCYNNGELPDTNSLRKRLELKLKMEGLSVSADCANLLNNGLDVFLKRLLKPCLDLADSRRQQKSCVSMTDFLVAMQLNPWLLGQDWPTLLEKASLRASEVYMDE